MQIQRLTYSIFKNVPRQQKLGATYDYIHRLLDFKLLAEDNEYHGPETHNTEENGCWLTQSTISSTNSAIATLNQDELIQ